MNENNVFLQSEKSFPEPYRGNPKNQHGHETAMANGGNGHYIGDGCEPTVSIDGYLWVLVVVAVILIKLTTKKQ